MTHIKFNICRAMAPTFMQMTNIMRGSGMQTKEVAGDECIMLMDLFMKENGMMINGMDKECLDYVSTKCFCFHLYLPSK